MKKIFTIIIALQVIGLPSKAQEPLSPEVNRMIEYLMLADEAGLDVPLYIMELSDQLAMLSLTNYMDQEILDQGAAAAELYAHPLVCTNYAACLMKQRKYGSALHYLNKAWKQDNQNVMVATNMARCHYEMGDEKNCEAFLSKALALNPDYGLALQLKATLLLKKKTQESNLEAVDYVLRSALDVWNGVSVQQFNSLIAEMQKLYLYYDGNHLNLPDDLKTLPTPLDGKERYFRQIIREGRVWADEPPADKFPYPHFMGTWEYEQNNGSNIASAAFGIDMNIWEKAQSVKIPFESSEYPGEYTGMMGGDEYQPDSRAFHMTLLAYFYHQIKLLEAGKKAGQYEDKETEPYRIRMEKAQEALMEKMTEQAENPLVVITPAMLKAYGEKYYQAGKEYVNACARAHVSAWEKFKRPALEAYSKDIKTGLIYIGNDTGFEFIQSRFDKDIATIYEYNELMYLAETQAEVNGEHGLASLGDDLLAELRKQDQDYQDYLTHSRNRRYLEWESDQNLRAAGMKDLNRSKDPVPSVSVKIGPFSLQVGIDRRNRIHFNYDSPDYSYNKVYNMETGASATTELREVKMTGDYASDVATTLMQDFTSRGHLSYTPEIGERSGVQVVTDGRGNIIESSNIEQQSASVSLSTNAPASGLPGFVADNLSVGVTYSVRKSSIKANRYGASVVPMSPRSTVTFDIGVGVKGFNIFSGSFGAAQGGF